eukprot:CAMPEP_0115407440 /NCGR_PEP_ID=MMETSP0271-20121206/18963_1 /TAXON_ID=71861 /ORGANISM="Scrippsiella trochoidea, Strain CCMP3099" /LENGTH=114 /DNA_ID=CAMNT_0002831503 /DNA_START=84 /DNA_END=425 /DNA_ORIENTATION=+
MARSSLALASLLCLGVPAAAYVMPGTGAAASIQQRTAAASAPGFPDVEEATAEPQEVGAMSWIAASLGMGAVLGWLSARRQQVASAAGAAALAVAPAAGLAIVDYDAVKYLGGT